MKKILLGTLMAFFVPMVSFGAGININAPFDGEAGKQFSIDVSGDSENKDINKIVLSLNINDESKVAVGSSKVEGLTLTSTSNGKVTTVTATGDKVNLGDGKSLFNLLITPSAKGTTILTYNKDSSSIITTEGDNILGSVAPATSIIPITGEDSQISLDDGVYEDQGEPVFEETNKAKTSDPFENYNSNDNNSDTNLDEFENYKAPVETKSNEKISVFPKSGNGSAYLALFFAAMIGILFGTAIIRRKTN